jgi:hypothetical protein
MLPSFCAVPEVSTKLIVAAAGNEFTVKVREAVAEQAALLVTVTEYEVVEPGVAVLTCPLPKPLFQA